MTGVQTAKMLEQLKGEIEEMRAEVSEMRQRKKEELLSVSEVETNHEPSMKRLIAAIKKNKKHILKLEGKCELLIEMMQKKEDNIPTQMHNVAIQPLQEVQDEIKLKKSLEMNEIETEDEAKNKDEITNKIEKLERNETLVALVINERMLELKTALDVKLTEIKNHMEKLNAAQLLKMEPKTMSSFDLISGNVNCQPDVTTKMVQNMVWLGFRKFEERSMQFKWPGYPVVATATVAYEVNGTACVSLHLQYQSQQKRENLKLLPNVYYVIRDHAYAKHKCQNVFHFFKTPPCEYKYITDVSKQDNKSLEIYLESAEMARQAYSYDGTLDWTIDNFRKRKLMEREGSIACQESPYFYTGPKGYRVQLHLKLSGKANIIFLTGEFDEDLTEPFPHQLTITLIDQNDPKDNFIRTATKDIPNERSYDFNLGSENDVLFAVDNDTLIVKVAIKPLEIHA